MSYDTIIEVSESIVEALNTIDEIYVVPYPQDLNLSDPVQGAIMLAGSVEPTTADYGTQPILWELNIFIESTYSGSNIQLTEQLVAKLISRSATGSIMGVIANRDLAVDNKRHLEFGVRCTSLEIARDAVNRQGQTGTLIVGTIEGAI